MFRPQNRDLGNRASPACHMNTLIFLQRKEWRGEISETEPAQVTGLLGPDYMSRAGPVSRAALVWAGPVVM